MEILAIILVTLGAIAGMAFAINFFWRTGMRRACGLASFFAAIFLVFWASGMWQGANQHAWGSLTPLFALMLGAGWLLVLLGKKLFAIYRDKTNEQDRKQ